MAAVVHQEGLAPERPATPTEIWRLPVAGWIAIVLALFLVGFVFHDGIDYLLRQWESPEYSYGYLIPVLAVFLIWQRRDRLQPMQFNGSWLGVGVVGLGLFLHAAGSLGAVYTVVHYAMVVVLAGLTLACTGRAGFRAIWVALVLLLFMVPLPGFLYQSLSNQLQLWSSSLGVGVIRLFGISVFLEGNVIDLGAMKLQVVEACNGLRYLFPLVTLGFIASYFYRAPFWKRAVLVVSTIPITVLMNSLRIGVVGVLVEYYGRQMAEGFLHDFEGWIIFMACAVVLISEMWVLSRIGNQTLGDSFRIDLPPPLPRDTIAHVGSVPPPLFVAAGLLATAAIATIALPNRAVTVPERAHFNEFALGLGDWQGRRDTLERGYVDSLKFDDYLLADFVHAAHRPVNLYIGYYATQNADKVPHSPRACIPAGGWAIVGFDRRELTPTTPGAIPFAVNRAVIERGRDRHLVYYWFKQRDRSFADEYRTKWYIFWDTVTRRRSDGALVRLVTPMADGESIASAEVRLVSFTRELVPRLNRYVPD